MRLLHFSESYGIVNATFIRSEVEYFVSRTEFKYLCQNVHEPYTNEKFLTVIPFEDNLIFKLIRWRLLKYDLLYNFYNPSFAQNVTHFVKNFSPEIIHCHFANEAIKLLDNINFDKYKIILHFHGYDASQETKKKSYLRKLKKLLSNKNVFPISCNTYFVNLLSTKLNIQSDRFFVLRYGIDINIFQPENYTSKKGKNIFLQVSSLAEKKGHEYTIQAFALFLDSMPDKNYYLIITGDGERKSILIGLVKKLNIEKNVIFRGFVTPEEVAKLMSEADVFVHHSITPSSGNMEGIPNAVLEAMAMELPVVSTYHSGIPEAIEDGVNGFLVKERDIVNYSIKMKEALQLGRLSQSRQKIKQEYTRENHNSRLENFYNTILNSSNKSNSEHTF